MFEKSQRRVISAYEFETAVVSIEIKIVTEYEYPKKPDCLMAIVNNGIAPKSIIPLYKHIIYHKTVRIGNRIVNVISDAFREVLKSQSFASMQSIAVDVRRL